MKYIAVLGVIALLIAAVLFPLLSQTTDAAAPVLDSYNRLALWTELGMPRWADSDRITVSGGSQPSASFAANEVLRISCTKDAFYNFNADANSDDPLALAGAPFHIQHQATGTLEFLEAGTDGICNVVPLDAHP